MRVPTVFARHRFTVKEGATGAPFVMFEVAKGQELPILGNGFLALELREGTTLERAAEICEMLNQSVSGTSYTCP